MLLKDMITAGVVFLELGDTLEKAVRLFRIHKMDIIPVVDKEQKIIGVFTRSNLYDALLTGVSLQEKINSFVNGNVFSLPGDLAFESVADVVKNSTVGTAPVLNTDGTVIGLFTKTDMVMTLLKKAETTNTQLKAILDSMYNGVIVVNSRGEIVLLNLSAERIFKTTVNSWLGMTLRNVLPDLDLTPALQLAEVKVGIKLKYGEIVTLANVTPLKDGNKITGAICIFQDLTDIEQIARELDTVKALNTTLDTVLNIIYDGIIVVNEDGYVTLGNRALLDYLEISSKEMIGKHVTEILNGTRLHVVANNGIPEISDIQTINNKPLIVSRLPIIKDGKAVGAVGKFTFPQLAETQELVSKLSLLKNKIAYYQEELKKVKTEYSVLDSIIAESAIMRKMKIEIKQVAQSISTVFITGESGTGKELVAEAVHMNSNRKSGPFVKVNCAAIPDNLLEAELFGYSAGAFTGASKNGKLGRFEIADGGTIFLDEIGDMPIALQAKILRAIQQREFERLGNNKVRKVDVRIIAATNKDIRKAILEGKFREDLYYRLNVIGLQLPPLRERPEDIQPLVNNFIGKYNEILNTKTKGISQEALAILQAYSWPGNIRELENVIERAVNYALFDYIKIEHLPSYLISIQDGFYNEAKENEKSNMYRTRIYQTEKELILDALNKAGGNKTKAAKLLHLSRSRLYVKMKNHGIT